MAISIHVPREGDDLCSTIRLSCKRNFNPRPPRGGRPRRFLLKAARSIFQSTSPARGTTTRSFTEHGYIIFQSTSPARGTTDCRLLAAAIAAISIHVPREGDDAKLRHNVMVSVNFNPRPPRGGRQHRGKRRARRSDFNPRPPRGGRLFFPSLYLILAIFQSTSPARGTTEYLDAAACISAISIHVPREGDDWISHRFTVMAPPISIHVPREGDDLTERPATPVGMPISIHVPREGDDTVSNGFVLRGGNFNPRPPRGGRRHY